MGLTGRAKAYTVIFITVAGVHATLDLERYKINYGIDLRKIMDEILYLNNNRNVYVPNCISSSKFHVGLIYP